ncbi:CvfB family protein [Oceanisphaera avium]|uniref:Nucleotide-binding protein n=1 Tax=Oceanisphaera avium TaxID=1903694 RepID=A0A1Y0CWC2_9GAMM|nr:S1-like domain-containing RNA-binding protein [Oceanisphaera avium]ART79631.1 nucleotide-binding protein [Oceanisphaera avium]
MIKLGDNNNLPVLRLEEKGAWLDASPYGEVFITQRQLPAHCQPGDHLSVFIYLDADLAPVATTEQPKAKVEQFASLKVVTSNRLGAFLDWGMKKDIFVPERNQASPMEVGRNYVVYIYLDHEGRMVASSKLDRFLSREFPDYQVGAEVDLVITERTQLGFKALVDNAYGGLIFASDTPGHLPVGLHTKGYIKQVRDDGKLDLSLIKPQVGKQDIDATALMILDKLSRAGGHMAVNDKTDPDTIFRLFGTSKGTFKKAIGGLYKQGKISIEKDGIKLR